MNLSTLKLAKIKVIILASLMITGTATASHFILVSNTISDHLKIVGDNDRKPLKIEYSPGEKLGDGGKVLKTGKWEQFGIKLNNNSPEDSEPWKSILIRTIFHGISQEFINAQFKKDTSGLIPKFTISEKSNLVKQEV